MLEIVMHGANCSIQQLDDVTQLAFQDPESQIAVAVRLTPEACQTIAARLSSGHAIVVAPTPLVVPKH